MLFHSENMARRVSFGEPAPEQQRPKAQRYRGVSFKKEYEPQNTFQKLKKAVAPKGGRKRAPSMIHGALRSCPATEICTVPPEPTKHMIPPKRRDDKTRYTIVLDLDETLIYAREGPLYARPYACLFLGIHRFISSCQAFG